MKLVKDQASGYPMPPHSTIYSVVLFTDSLRMAIPIVDLYRILNTREKIGKSDKRKLSGVPMLMAVRSDDNTLEFFPAPDRDYEIIIRYAGPLQEI